MRAVAKLKGSYGAVGEIEADPPTVRDHEVLIRVAAGGVCGTDVHFYEWPEYMAREYAPLFPLIMGHEFAGAIVETGSGVSDLEPGAAVTVNPHLCCGRCFFCTAGRSALCDNRPILGCNRNGGWAELVSVPRENVHVLPRGIEATVGALAEPLSVAVHAVVERVAVEPGDTVIITGPGPVGLLILLVARVAGAKHILVAGLSSDHRRLRLAAQLGGIPVNIAEEDLAAAVRKVNPRGADVAYEASGHPGALNSVIHAIQKGGRIALLGFADDLIPADALQLVVKEKELIGVRAYNRNTWRKSVAMLPDLASDLKLLISHALPFSQVEEAFALIRQRECMKVILKPE